MSFHLSSDAERFDPDDGITIIDNGVAEGGVSVVRAELHGKHIGHPNRRSITTYVITDGLVTIAVDGEKHPLTSGDMVVAPVNSLRELEGTGSLLIINAPEYDPADES